MRRLYILSYPYFKGMRLGGRKKVSQKIATLNCFPVRESNPTQISGVEEDAVGPGDVYS